MALLYYRLAVDMMMMMMIMAATCPASRVFDTVLYSRITLAHALITQRGLCRCRTPLPGQDLRSIRAREPGP